MKKLLIFLLLLNFTAHSQQQNFYKKYSVFHESQGDDLIITSDGNYLLSGFTNYHNGPQQSFLFKLDQHGDVIWGRLSPVMGNNYPGFVIETSSHNYLAVENPYFSIIKMYDTSGTVLWSTNLDLGLNTRIFGAVEINNSIYCFGKYTFGSADKRFMYKTNEVGDTLLLIDSLTFEIGTNKISYCTFNHNIAFCSTNYSNSLDYDPTITLIDTNGNELWTKTYPDISHNYGKSIIVNNSGDFYFNKKFSNSFIKTDSAGNILWTKGLLCGNEQQLVNWNNNDFIIATDQCVVRYDSSGTLIDSLSFPNIPQYNAVAFTDSSYAFAGSPWVTDSAFVIQFSDTSYLLNIEDERSSSITLFPNPFQSYINIETNSQSRFRIKIIDLNGRIVLNRIISEKAYLSTAFLNEGIYSVVIESDKNILVRKKIVKIDME